MANPDQKTIFLEQAYDELKAIASSSKTNLALQIWK